MDTPSILKEIVAKKQETLAKDKANISLDAMIDMASIADDRPSFYYALAKDGLSIIGEIKKASPSKGLIREDFDPIAIAKEYEVCVDALSILTEEDYFQGSSQYLYRAAQVVDMPILRKDFIIDEYQIYEAKVLGASAILLIVAILDKDTIAKYIELANSLGLDALVETHSVEEAQIATAAGAQIIGVNNRDLHTFNVDIDMTNKVAKAIGEDIILVSESGIATVDDIVTLKSANIDAILVGESFMRCDDIAIKAKEFKNGYTS